MKSIRLGAGSVNQTPMDWEGNKKRILAAITEGSEKQIQSLCLPELCITGYGCEDMFHSLHLQEKAVEVLKEIKEEVPEKMTVMVGLPIRYRNALYNCVAVLQTGEICGIVPKQSMAQDGVHYEPRWFRGWERGEVVDIKLGQNTIPFGDLVFENEDGIRFGFEICEDAWVADRPGSDLSKRGVDIIFNPSASHFSIGKHEIRRSFIKEGSRSFGCAYVYANLVGNESGKIIYDGSSVIASEGAILQEGKRFSLREFQTIHADVDLNLSMVGKTDKEGFTPEGVGKTVDVKGKVNQVPHTNTKRFKEDWEKHHTWQEGEEFEKAVTLGLFDYMRKSGVNGYCVSLSGGADSSATATLVASMVERVYKELTEDDLIRRGIFLKGDGHLGLKPKITKDVLTCFYQPTSISSETTREAAEKVASDIGAKYFEMDVDSIVEAYKDVVGTSLNTEWNWDRHDISLQNIQARSRAPSAWMVANVEGKILLATSNRSEASVGYFSQGGDDSGGLAPILGIDKTFLRKWLLHKEKDYSSLAYVNVQKPSAELQPEEEEQTDEDDLMPYKVLNRIEKLAILEKKDPKNVWMSLQVKFPDYSKNELGYWTIRFFKLWCRNQWKRERGAPSFYLCDRSVDPKSWCRFPILSGGFEEEIEELLQELETTLQEQ